MKLKCKKIFAISDIHGHYHITINALKQAGWDSENEDHLLIVCGDIFDRGIESLKVFEWLKSLTESRKAIILRGNHDYFLMNFLKGSDESFNYIYNGLSFTLNSFLGTINDFGTYVLSNQRSHTNGSYSEWAEITRIRINDEYPDLLPWLESFPDYYETENYIFTHGSIDTESEDWKEPKKSWYRCHWDDGSFFSKPISNTKKTIVIGHFGTQHLREIYGYDTMGSVYDILKRNDGRVIAIDTTTILSKRVNVLEIEDEVKYEIQNKQ